MASDVPAGFCGLLVFLSLLHRPAGCSENCLHFFAILLHSAIKQTDIFSEEPHVAAGPTECQAGSEPVQQADEDSSSHVGCEGICH